ncbi:inorganic pyrophosphatase [Helicobacter suis HS5]|uniref:Inorganic pyrophosphatase n=2 Tax=Helicobacter suis TaxID=104628 RepID=E7G2F3_9HELI|nr:inorganic pyrophosphatase [Helicobacter suis HS5]EFX42862.1 inorganic pyrophosphatase [Helicobacter suis HS1]
MFMNISKIPVSNADVLNAVIEIPYGSRIKYEVDEESGAVVVDRVMFTSMVYPANYGFIPHTLSDDGDPADILVLNEDPLQAGSVIKCRLIGVLIMEDGGLGDEKLLAVPLSKIDPRYAHVKSLEDLAPIVLQKIRHFFETYKDLEPQKWVKVKDFGNKAQAEEILRKALANYQQAQG